MRRKKKLLVFSTQLMSTGGIESHINVFLEEFSKTHEYDIDLIVLNAQIGNAQIDYLKSLCRFAYLLRGKKDLKTILFIIKRSLKSNYDALYTNGQGNSVLLIKRVFNWKKWVHHHHTSGDFLDQKTWSKPYLAVLRECDVLIACSIRNARNMEEVLNREVHTIPVFSKDLSNIIYKYDQNRDVQLGYFGRLIPEKGIDLLCKLSEDSKLKNVKINIWGEGENYDESFFAQFPNISFHGKFTGKKELRRVISSIDGFLLLSVHPEGLPVSLLELMSAGVPWMATNKGGISDIALDPVATRLIYSLTPYKDLRAQVKKFILDIKSEKIDRSQQKTLYQEKFSSNVLIRKWSKVLFK